MILSLMAYRLEISKDRIKFSAAHFTVFGSEKAERLHGHNYYIHLCVESQNLNELGFAIEMDDLKQHIFALSQELDEHILIAQNNPYLKVQEKAQQTEVTWNDKFYSFPKEDVKLLPISNITCENLSYWLWQNMAELLPKQVNYLKVSVCETHGQQASFEQELTI